MLPKRFAIFVALLIAFPPSAVADTLKSTAEARQLRHRLIDWTAGCIAVTDPEIEELYRIVPDGTPIELHP